MAKKKKEESEELSGLSKFEADLIKKYGEGIIRLGSDIQKNSKKIIPISPAIDSICGGAEEGSLINMAGPEGCGKSTMALTLCRNAMMPEHGSRPVCWLDGESRMNKKLISGINGLDGDKIYVVRSSKEKRLSGEEFCDIGLNFLKTHENGIVVVDSVSAMCPASEITEGVSGSIRSTNPRIMASFCRQAAGIIEPMNNIVITIHHLISNTSGMGEHLLVDGGGKLRFQASLRLVTKNKPKVWVDDDGETIGQVSTWMALKTAIGQPLGEADCYIRYGYGIDEVTEAVNIAIQLGIIDVSGAWYKLHFVEEGFKLQGVAKVYDFVRENPQWVKYINEQILSLGDSEDVE